MIRLHVRLIRAFQVQFVLSKFCSLTLKVIKALEQAPDNESRIAITQLINSEISLDAENTEHPSLSSAREPNLPPLIQAEIERIESESSDDSYNREISKAIDITRYEAPDVPNLSASGSQWRTAFRQVQINDSYLSERILNLGLLERYGKNCWLIGNSFMEDILTQLQSQLVETRREIENVEKRRKEKQASVSGEMIALGESWKEGIEKLLAAEAATERLRLKILTEMGKIMSL